MTNHKSALTKKLIGLAQLSVPDSKLATLNSQLKSIFTYFDQIKELDLANVEETTRVSNASNVWREDVIQKSLSQAEALANASHQHQGFFVVDYLLKNKDQ